MSSKEPSLRHVALFLGESDQPKRGKVKHRLPETFGASLDYTVTKTGHLCATGTGVTAFMELTEGEDLAPWKMMSELS